jgi:hypothetical protein
MCNPKFKKDLYKKRFFRPNNPLLQMASNIIKSLDGSNEEKLGQFEMVVKTEQFQRKYPGLMGKDVATIVRLELSKF